MPNPKPILPNIEAAERRGEENQPEAEYYIISRFLRIGRSVANFALSMTHQHSFCCNGIDLLMLASF